MNEYKAILKPIWTYEYNCGDQHQTLIYKPWKDFQSKVLRIITDAPWYVPNVVIKRDLKCAIGQTRSAQLVSPTVKGLKITQQTGKIFISKNSLQS